MLFCQQHLTAHSFSSPLSQLGHLWPAFRCWPQAGWTFVTGTDGSLLVGHREIQLDEQTHVVSEENAILLPLRYTVQRIHAREWIWASQQAGKKQTSKSLMQHYHRDTGSTGSISGPSRGYCAQHARLLIVPPLTGHWEATVVSQGLRYYQFVKPLFFNAEPKALLDSCSCTSPLLYKCRKDHIKIERLRTSSTLNLLTLNLDLPYLFF